MTTLWFIRNSWKKVSCFFEHTRFDHFFYEYFISLAMNNQTSKNIYWVHQIFYLTVDKLYVYCNYMRWNRCCCQFCQSNSQHSLFYVLKALEPISHHLFKNIYPIQSKFLSCCGLSLHYFDHSTFPTIFFRFKFHFINIYHFLYICLLIKMKIQVPQTLKIGYSVHNW